MIYTLRYGVGATLELELAADALIAHSDAPVEPPIDDVMAAVATALDDPLDFPPLARAMVSGDRVAVVVDRDLPQPVELVSGVVRSLLACGADASNITVVFPADPLQATADASRGILRKQLQTQLGTDVQFTTHDPTDDTNLSYIGVSADDRPIRINRTIHDAELVLPIGCLRWPCAPGFRGVHGCLFPAFSDQETILRFRCCECLESVVRQAKLQKEIDEVAKLLGIMLTIQVVPGPNGRVMHVLAGEAGCVERKGGQLHEMQWHLDVPRRASLVVATLSGGATEQTWDHVVRALASATQAVEEDGAIVLCSELSVEPGPMVRQLSHLEETDEISQAIRSDSSHDAWAALELARVTDRGSVYLLSQLEEDVVEELGIAPVADIAEIHRLVSRHETCILLSDAHHRLPKVVGEEVKPVEQARG